MTWKCESSGEIVPSYILDHGVLPQGHVRGDIFRSVCDILEGFVSWIFLTLSYKNKNKKKDENEHTVVWFIFSKYFLFAISCLLSSFVNNCTYTNIYVSTFINIYGADVVEWSRALDIMLSDWCCSVSMVWVQIPSREEQKFDSSKIWF